MNTTVIDALMGEGKTSWAIQQMASAPIEEKFIYVTPFLDEVQRIKNSIPHRQFDEPDNKNESGSKLESLKSLLSSNCNISTTHELFKHADEEFQELLTEFNYTLILDEAFSAVEVVAGCQERDVTRLIRAEDIVIDPITKRVDWIGDPTNGAKYDDIRILAQSGTLFCYNNRLFIWTFPPEIFKSFKHVYVMTYLFDGQFQRFYFKLFNIEYEKRAVTKDTDGTYKLIDYDATKEPRKELYNLINLHQDKRNNYKKYELTNRNGKKYDATVTFGSENSQKLAKSEEFVEKANSNLRGFFLTDCKAKRDEVMYTAKKELLAKLGPTGYKEPNVTKAEREAFYDIESNKNREVPKKVKVAVNSRATNMYAHKRVLAYLFNCYMHVNTKRFFNDAGAQIDNTAEDTYAVGELLQWIFRSRIRNGEPIELYLPSSRMRNLLKQWANYEI